MVNWWNWNIFNIAIRHWCLFRSRVHTTYPRVGLLSGHWSVKSAMGKSFDIMLLGCFFTLIKYKSSFSSLTNIAYNLPRFKSQSIYIFATLSLANHYLNIAGKKFILTHCYWRNSCKDCVCYPKRERFRI